MKIFVAAVLSGCGLILSFPPFNLSYLAFIAIFPLMWGVVRAERLTQAVWGGWLTGALFYYGSSWWISHSMIHYGGIPFPVAHLLTLAAAAFLGSCTALFAGAFYLTTRKNSATGIFLAPCFWTLGEFVRLNVLGMGWNPLSNAVALQPTLIQSARFGGAYLISALLVAFSALAIYALRGGRDAVIAALGTVGLAAVIFTDGKFALSSVKSGSLVMDVVAVQPMTPIEISNPAEYFDALERHRALSESGLKQTRTATRLVVWPESQMGFDLDEPEPNAQREMMRITTDGGAYVLFNGTRRVGGRFANIVALMSANGGRPSEYQKMYLMPFGEYVPFRQFLPFEFGPLAMDAEPGRAAKPLTINGEKVGATICFESTVPALTNSLRRQGVGAFVNVANDGWFGMTPGTAQHLRHLVLRSIETGCETIRVTNTGVSCRILANGEVAEMTPQGEATVRTWPLTLRDSSEPLTFYARRGDVFAWLCVVASVVGILGALWRRVRQLVEDIREMVAGE
jgi:apolipoprotein N-acyltransferase